MNWFLCLLLVVMTYMYLKTKPKLMDKIVSLFYNLFNKRQSIKNSEQIMGKYPFGRFINRYKKSASLVIPSRLSYPPCQNIQRIFGEDDSLEDVGAVCTVIKADNEFLHKWKVFVGESYTSVLNDFIHEIQNAYKEEY